MVQLIRPTLSFRNDVENQIKFQKLTIQLLANKTPKDFI